MTNKALNTSSSQEALVKQIVGWAMKVHRVLGCGFVEAVYRNALMIELRQAGVSFECHPTLSVTYEGNEVGVFQADLIIGRELIVELKAVEALHSTHSAQLVNYLAATGIDHGLLLNFGARSLEFRTKNRFYPGREAGISLQLSHPVNLE